MKKQIKTPNTLIDELRKQVADHEEEVEKSKSEIENLKKQKTTGSEKLEQSEQ